MSDEFEFVGGEMYKREFLIYEIGYSIVKVEDFVFLSFTYNGISERAFWTKFGRFEEYII